jgi:serine/threonine protein kinase
MSDEQTDDSSVSMKKIAGRYSVLQVLNSGGMGEVCLALDERLGRDVALKMPFSRDPETTERFKLEAQALALLESDHIVRIYEYDTTRDGTPYIVMPFLPGDTLGALVHEHGAFSVPDAIAIMLQVLQGLAVAHARGFSHRDIKPDNIMILDMPGRERRAVIIDWGTVFGIQRDGDAGRFTREDRGPIGTAGYMAPERIGRKLEGDVRSDQFSVGCVLYLLLTGKPAFDLPGVTSAIVRQKVLTRDFVPLVAAGLPLPPSLIRVIERTMAQEPESRYPNVRQLGRELLSFAGPAPRRQFEPFFQDDPPGVHGDETGEREVDESLIARSQRSRPEKLPMVAVPPSVPPTGSSVAPRSPAPPHDPRQMERRQTPPGKGRARFGFAVAVLAVVGSAGLLMSRKRVESSQPNALVPRGPAVSSGRLSDPKPGQFDPLPRAVVPTPNTTALIGAADAAALPSPAESPGLTEIHVPQDVGRPGTRITSRGAGKRKPALTRRTKAAAPTARGSDDSLIQQLYNGTYEGAAR